MNEPCAEEPFAPKPRRPWLEFPGWPLASRGLGLFVLAGIFGSLCWLGLLAFGWWFLPGAVLCGLGAILSAWAGLIHLTGGEEFDDHPFV